MRITVLMTLLFGNLSLPAQEKQQSQTHFWYTLETSASADRIWEIWIDVENWKKWDTGLSDAMIQEDFEKGAKGKIISLEGRRSKFKIVHYDEGRSYTFKTKLPLGSLFVKRYLTLEDQKVYFTHEVWFKGFSKGFFSKRFGEKFKNMLPEVLLNIKKIVEEDDNT